MCTCVCTCLYAFWLSQRSEHFWDACKHYWNMDQRVYTTSCLLTATTVFIYTKRAATRQSVIWRMDGRTDGRCSCKFTLTETKLFRNYLAVVRLTNGSEGAFQSVQLIGFIASAIDNFVDAAFIETLFEPLPATVAKKLTTNAFIPSAAAAKRDIFQSARETTWSVLCCLTTCGGGVDKIFGDCNNDGIVS